MSQGWVIGFHLSCLLHSLFGGPQHMSISAGQYARELRGRPNLHRQIDWAFLALAGQREHCRDAWLGYVVIAARAKAVS